jgi:2-phospho-L-lactate guanylyltransferase
VNLAIVVPIKAFNAAKHRLDGLLERGERVQLARAMAEDVLEMVARVPGVGHYAVSEDPEALALAGRYGVETINDRAVQGQSAAVRQGFDVAWDRGFSAAVTIPGDVPGVSLDDLQALCTYRPEVEVVLVPDRDGLGTNGLRLILPHAIALRFGEDSLRLHQDEAERAGRSMVVLPLSSLAIDLDRPEDVAAYLRWAPATRALQVLGDLKIGDRLLAFPQRRA